MKDGTLASPLAAVASALAALSCCLPLGRFCWRPAPRDLQVSCFGGSLT